jgi:hypothetical protein
VGRDLLRSTLAIASVVAWEISASAGAVGQTGEKRVQVRDWPCRLVVKPTLLGVVDDGWKRSATLRRQCEELAASRAVVVLEWGTTDSQSHARSRMGVQGGVVVATVVVPPVAEAIELVAHELQHVLEKVRGVDFETEAKRSGSGVWRAFGGYETQAAIDAGRQVGRELRR